MHRRLIHRSYDCPLWLDGLFVYLGTLVGMPGPYGMIRQHDIAIGRNARPAATPISRIAHRSCATAFGSCIASPNLAHPPALVIERHVRDDRFYRFLERTWMAQQLPWAVFLRSRRIALGGLGYRGAGRRLGHRTLAGRLLRHNRGPRSWHIDGAGVRATTCAIAGSSPWARPGTTTTMRSRARRDWGFATTRPIPAGGCCARWPHQPVWA